MKRLIILVVLAVLAIAFTVSASKTPGRGPVVNKTEWERDVRIIKEVNVEVVSDYVWGILNELQETVVDSMIEDLKAHALGEMSDEEFYRNEVRGLHLSKILEERMKKEESISGSLN